MSSKLRPVQLGQTSNPKGVEFVAKANEKYFVKFGYDLLETTLYVDNGNFILLKNDEANDINATKAIPENFWSKYGMQYKR